MKILTKINKKFLTKDSKNEINGFLLPIYNVHENFFSETVESEQAWVASTTLATTILIVPNRPEYMPAKTFHS